MDIKKKILKKSLKESPEESLQDPKNKIQRIDNKVAKPLRKYKIIELKQIALYNDGGSLI